MSSIPVNPLERRKLSIIPTPPETPLAVKPLPVDRMITTRQAAKILGVSEVTMKKWRSRHKGPRFARYHDGVVRYSLADIIQYLQDHTVEP